MIEINVPEVNVDEIMERIREEIRRRKPDYCGAALPASECSNRGEIPQPSKPCFPHLESLPGPTPFVVKEGGYHINDFLQYHDQDFVRNAYRGILCREADLAGYN